MIEKKISDVLYQIQQEKSSRKQIVHFDRLKPYWTRQSEDNQEPIRLSEDNQEPMRQSEDNQEPMRESEDNQEPMRQSEDNQEPIVHHHTDEDYHIYIEPDATSSDPDILNQMKQNHRRIPLVNSLQHRPSGDPLELGEHLLATKTMSPIDHSYIKGGDNVTCCQLTIVRTEHV